MREKVRLSPENLKEKAEGTVTRGRKRTIVVGEAHQTKAGENIALLTHHPNGEESQGMHALTVLLDNLSSSAGASHCPNLIRSQRAREPTEALHACHEQPEKGAEGSGRGMQQSVTTEMHKYGSLKKAG